MSLITLEHGKWAYRADFALYGIAVLVLSLLIFAGAPAGQRLELGAFAAAGLSSWTLIEYALHRFVLHGLDPFQGWHAQHHGRPMALIASPTLFSASLIFGLVFVPVLLLSTAWIAGAVTLGVTIGYLAYAVVHHATHHWRADMAWLKRRKQWHALHHHRGLASGCYGVTTAFWDHVFGTAHRAAPRPGAGAKPCNDPGA